MDLKRILLGVCVLGGAGLCVWADGFSFSAAVPGELSAAPNSNVDWSFPFTTDPVDGTTVSVTGLPSGLKAKVDVSARKVFVSGTATKSQLAWMKLSGKNKAGYAHSAIVKVTVGTPTDPDYDQIGLQGRIVPSDAKAGDLLQVLVPTLLDSSIVSDLKSITFSGLPSGAVYRAEPLPFLTGYLTKPGKYVVKMTVALKSGGKLTAQQTVVVKDAGCQLVSVAEAPGFPGGTVSKNAVVAWGGKTTLTAKPQKGYVFAGWYSNAACTKELPQDVTGVDYRTPSFSYRLVEGASTQVYARFCPKEKDSAVTFLRGNGSNAPWTVNAGSMSMIDILAAMVTGVVTFEGVGADSYSLPTLSFKGLPPGCTYNKSMGALVFKKSPEKPGIYTVVATAKNVSGAKDQKTFQIIVPNLRSSLLEVDDAKTFYDQPHEMAVGGEHADSLDSIRVAEGCKVTVSGLPPGVKATQEGDEVYFTGVPTKAGDYTVFLTIKNGTTTEKASITVHVNPFPSPLVGEYYGVLKKPYPSSDYVGTFKITVAASGKATAKFTLGKKTYSFSATPCGQTDCAADYHNMDEEKTGFFAQFTLDASTDHVMLRGVDEYSNTIEIYDRDANGKVDLEASVRFEMSGSKNLAAVKGTSFADRAAKFAKLGALKAFAGNTTCEGDIWGIEHPHVAPGKTANLTVKVQTSGLVTIAGKIEGRSVSATTGLRFNPSNDEAFVETVVESGTEKVYLFMGIVDDKPAAQTIQDGHWYIQ